MYIITGLGNPEADYARTRHNMGFDAINMLAKKCDIELSRTKFNAIYGTGIIENEKVILIKPQTFMNASGESVKKYMDFYKVPLSKIIVIYDDMDTDKGQIRIRSKGGPGTHNGMKSVVNELKSEEFPRIRVGIGRPTDHDSGDKINYVIGPIEDAEYDILKEAQEEAAKAVIDYIKNGIDHAMNKFN